MLYNKSQIQYIPTLEHSHTPDVNVTPRFYRHITVYAQKCDFGAISRLSSWPWIRMYEEKKYALWTDGLLWLVKGGQATTIHVPGYYNSTNRSTQPFFFFALKTCTTLTLLVFWLQKKKITLIIIIIATTIIIIYKKQYSIIYNTNTTQR